MHPIETGSYILGTMPIEDWANCCAHWSEIGLPGGFMYGERRLGKTFAAFWLRDHKDAIFGRQCAFFFIPARMYSTSTPRKFLSHLAQATGYALFSSGDELVLRARLLTHLVECVANLEDRRIILVIDEAQDLSRIDYKLLINLSNELQVEGVRLMVLLIGQPELKERQTLFKSTKQKHILGRFMLDSIELRGIESVGELRHVYSQYDTKLFFPPDSGICFTQAYAGENYARGFRMEVQADVAWRGMAMVRDEAGIKSPMSIPMQSITSFSNYVLIRLAPRMQETLVLSDDQVREALENTGFLLLE